MHKPNESFSYRLYATLSDEVSNFIYFEGLYKYDISPILISIAGGNRLLGYSSPLNIDASLSDPDVPVSSGVIPNFNTTWSCIDLNKNLPCRDIENNPIILPINAV